MNESITSLPPWDDQTELFDHPIAICEMVLDGRGRLVSMVLWENYCYLKVAGLKGLWGITRPYDGSDVSKFASENIERGEVGRVWSFKRGFANLDYTTGKPILDMRASLVADSPIPLIAVIRQDNSALVREAETCPFFETPAPAIKKPRIKQAHIPSIWHPSRQFIERRQIARLATPLVHRIMPREELFKWKKGSLSEAVMLLEALCFYASKGQAQHHWDIPFKWPLKHQHLVHPGYELKANMNILPFIEVIWEHHHPDTTNWLPARGAHYLSVGYKRYEWRKATKENTLLVRRNPFHSAHELLEATSAMMDLFEGKVSDSELNELIKDGARMTLDF